MNPFKPFETLDSLSVNINFETDIVSTGFLVVIWLFMEKRLSSYMIT